MIHSNYFDVNSQTGKQDNKQKKYVCIKKMEKIIDYLILFKLFKLFTNFFFNIK